MRNVVGPGVGIGGVMAGVEVSDTVGNGSEGVAVPGNPGKAMPLHALNPKQTNTRINRGVFMQAIILTQSGG